MMALFGLSPPLAVIIAVFLLAGAGVWAAGTTLAAYADQIAKRRKLAEGLVGLLFLAGATELPEIATTFSAAVAGNAKLVLNNLFGGVTLNTAILAVVDGLMVRGVLTFYPRKPTHALEATLLIVLLALLIGVCSVGDHPIAFQIGYGSVVLLIAYAISVKLLRAYDEQSGWLPIEVPEASESSPANSRADGLSMPALVIWSALLVATILVCGVILVETAEQIAVRTGLGSSYVGVTLLAAATSLPELSTTIAAARLGAFTMAISNIFGSNLIMLALLFPADVLYREGAILDAAGRPEIVALVAGILVTTVYVIGLLVRRKSQFLGMGFDSIIVLALYFSSLVVLYFV